MKKEGLRALIENCENPRQTIRTARAAIKTACDSYTIPMISGSTHSVETALRNYFGNTNLAIIHHDGKNILRTSPAGAFLA
jgi:hypothetical protein